mgnify:CR=1 FL=1
MSLDFLNVSPKITRFSAFKMTNKGFLSSEIKYPTPWSELLKLTSNNPFSSALVFAIK